MIAASFFMVYFVFPQFLLLFESFSIELPTITKIFLDVIKFMNANWYFVYGGLVGGFIIFYMYVNSEKGKRWWDQKKHRLPLFGELFRKLVISRFCWIMNGLLRSGMPMVEALETVSSAVGITSFGISSWRLRKKFVKGEISLRASRNMIFFLLFLLK